MSRHTIPGVNPDHDVVAGWDPPLCTFFAIVLDPTKDEYDDAYNPLWVGVTFGEIEHVVDLAEKLKPYAEIQPGVLQQLIVDRDRDT